jgi:hypothetical protein
MRVPARDIYAGPHLMSNVRSWELQARDLHLDIAGCASCGVSVEGAIIRTP